MNGVVARALDRLRAGERPSIPDATPAAAVAWRAEITEALLADLRPSDHTVAVWLLEQEIAAIRAIRTIGAVPAETLYRLIAAVARFAQPEDALLIWRAAQTTAETRVGVDVEQALRAGPEAVLRVLRQRIAEGSPHAEDAAAALAWVQEGIASGAANDLPAYFAWSDERFGLHISGPT